MKIYQENLLKMKKIVKRYTEDVTNFEIVKSVAEIIENVKNNGDQALKEYSEKFDKVSLANGFKIEQSELIQAYKELPKNLKKALNTAKENITSFHKQEIVESFVDLNIPGIVRGQKIIPLDKVGLYVPGGTAAYPSTILMNAIPAKIAGVNKIIMVTPPQKEGINKMVLAAAYLAGVSSVYQVGGAQAIAALAYGTESIPKVDKIVGPGNIFVATAKQQVFGKVAIDMVAGPSEIGIIADRDANPKEIAADLLSQAEHDKRARAMLVTDNLNFAKEVSKQVDIRLETLPRKEIAQASIQNRSFIAVMNNQAEMFELMNEISPEHLELQIKDPITAMGKIKNAGSVFLGRYASEPLGDYLAGPNHVLPTGGTARFASPLGVYDFIKRTQFLQYTKDALSNVANQIADFARAEGLEAHARAVESRFGEEDK